MNKCHSLKHLPGKILFLTLHWYLMTNDYIEIGWILHCNDSMMATDLSLCVLYWTPKETLQSSLLYYFIKSDYTNLLHLVKVMHDVLGQMLNLNPVQWSETFVGLFERFARPARYLYFRVICRWKNQYDREGVFQNNDKSSEIDSKTHTLRTLPCTIH